jgi:hypothetical protein
MMQRLAATSVLLKEEGLATLAKADAKAFRKRPCPTYDTIDAGMFSRALAAENGRKGGSASAKLVRDFFDPKVKQSKKNKRKAKNIIFSGTPAGAMTGDAKRAHIEAGEAGGSTPAGAMTGAAKRAHIEACEAGGSTPAGKMTGDAKRTHTDKTEAGGGCTPGAMTGDAKRAHIEAGEAGGSTPAGKMAGDAKRAHTDIAEAGGGNTAGKRISDEDHLRLMIGWFIKKEKDGSPIAVSRLTVCTDSENTYTFYASRDASLKDYNAFCFGLTREKNRELYNIMCTSGAKRPNFVLPLSNDSCCEGDAIGGRGWSREAYSNLKKKGVTWSVQDVLITDDMVLAHKLEKAAKKAKAKAKAAEGKKKRKRLAPSAPGPGVGKRRTT